MVSNLVTAKLPAASTIVALILLSINLSTSSASPCPSELVEEEDEEEKPWNSPAPSNENLPSPENPPTWFTSSPSSSTSILAKTPSCWSVESLLWTGITSSSSATATTHLFRLVPEKIPDVWGRPFGRKMVGLGLDLGSMNGLVIGRNRWVTNAMAELGGPSFGVREYTWWLLRAEWWRPEGLYGSCWVGRFGVVQCKVFRWVLWALIVMYGGTFRFPYFDSIYINY